MPDIVECPKCGKCSIVSPSHKLYQCLSCDFKRDLSTQIPKRSPNQEFPWLLVVLFITLISFLYTPDQPPTRFRPHQAREFLPEVIE
ncbi:hypothetical protein ACQ4M4_03930 [Leptolyngbya sp. AN02str]|uniref:hypothetical protein n=1 Tax=Leptolyngbya sp. AN02str TaxID=3423363 RepID=UPI003D31D442